MADTVTPSSGNPYLALLQQEQKPPGWAQILQHIGNLGFGLAGGFGQAAATGQPTMAAIGPGLMMGNQLNAQAAHQAEKERMQRLELQFKAQEHEDKRAERLRKQKALEAFAGGGFNVTPQQGPLMGPQPQGPTGGGYDTRVAGLEGGTKKGGMVFNELGSGAFGPYQFMPATWAAVRAQNPSLNLPEDITQASREQHDAAHGAFKAGNAQGLQAAGFQPTPENLYLAHRFGLGGATAVLRADPEKPLHEVLPIDWQRQNPDMRGQTAGGFRRLAAERVGGSSVPYVVRPDAKPTQYSLMPDDVPFELSSGSMTGPRPRTAEPTFTAPVMPQPTWEKPGDLVPVNPSFAPPPPATPAPGQPAPVPGQPGQPGQPPPPGTPTPGGPNVVQAQATPGPNTPPMVPGGGDTPPTRPVTPMPQPDPAFLAQVRAGVAGGIIKPDDGMAMLRQHVMDRYKQLDDAVGAQHATALEVYKQRQEGARHERGEKAKRDAEERAQARQLEAEQRRAEGEQQRHERDVADRQKAREDAAKQAGDKQSLEQTKAQRDQENKLRDDFNGLKPVQDFRKADLVFQSAQKAAKTDTAAADLNLVYAFATMMDPGSVVRDQETGMVIATQNASDRVKAMVSTVTGGSRLSPESKKALVAEMATRHSGYQEAYEAYATASEDIATRQGLDPRNVVSRVVVKKDEPAAPPPDAPPAAGAPPQPKTKADFDKLPKGTLFLDPQGNQRVKP